MRTLRTILVGSTSAMLLLCMSAITLMAQDDWASGDPADFVFVEGVESPGECGVSECYAMQHMSDPRVSGELVAQLDIGCSDEMVCWMGGDLMISNREGTWDGRWVGFINEDTLVGRSHDIMQWFEGRGAYEGWSYVAVLTDYDRAGTDVRGVVYRGDLPPSVAPHLVALAE